jgi:hypothetical protein
MAEFHGDGPASPPPYKQEVRTDTLPPMPSWTRVNNADLGLGLKDDLLLGAGVEFDCIAYRPRA